MLKTLQKTFPHYTFTLKEYSQNSWEVKVVFPDGYIRYFAGHNRDLDEEWVINELNKSI